MAANASREVAAKAKKVAAAASVQAGRAARAAVRGAKAAIASAENVVEGPAKRARKAKIKRGAKIAAVAVAVGAATVVVAKLARRRG